MVTKKRNKKPFLQSGPCYENYVGMAAGCMRADGVKVPEAIPNVAIFGAGYGFLWVEKITFFNPTQQHTNCALHRLELLDVTDWQRESGYLPVRCTECGWAATTNLWAHSGHSIVGTRNLCRICRETWTGPRILGQEADL